MKGIAHFSSGLFRSPWPWDIRTIPPKAPACKRAPLSDSQAYNLMREQAAAFGFAAFLQRVELDFIDRLYFVDWDGRMFAVMAFSPDDARRQVKAALARAYYTAWGLNA